MTPSRANPGAERRERRLGDVIREYLDASGLRRRLRQAPLFEAWERIVGPAIAEQARICDLRGHVLRVEVAHAALLQELAGFRKAEILAALNDAVANVLIRDIKFQLGKF